MSEERQEVNMPSRQEQIALARTAGERLRESREMAGINQLKAASLLGYANSSKLSKIEGGGDNSSQIPLWVIKRCACLYDVSVDYLLGITDAPEGENVSHLALRETVKRMEAHFEQQAHQDAITQQAILAHIAAIEAAFTVIDAEAAEAQRAMERIAIINPQWEGIRGGARLVDAVGRIRSARSRLAAVLRPGRGRMAEPPASVVRSRG